MAFSISVNKNEAFPVITLKNDAEDSAIEVYAFGALLNSFTIKGSGNIIDGFNSPQDAMDNITKGFKSAKLSPFVCRLAGGQYNFNGQLYKIRKFYLGDEAIHGLLYDAPFEIVNSGTSSEQAFVTLMYKYEKRNEGFPFSYSCAVTYLLDVNNRLHVNTVIKNNGDTDMPVSDGWHPYFTLGGKVDDLLFSMNTTQLVEFDNRLLPTGNTVEYKKFQQAEILGKTFLDNCFVLNGDSDAACILSNPATGLELRIWPGPEYRYLQVYTPEHRNSIAIENLSAVPDAFNNAIGLQVLNAGENISYKTSFHALMGS
jgi:aldose 1-epimerase